MYRRRALLAAAAGSLAAIAGCGGDGGGTRDIPVTVVNAADTPTDVSVSITDAKSGDAVAAYDGHLDAGASHRLTVHAPVPPPAYRVVATAGDRRAADTLGGSGFHRLSVNVLADGIELHTA